MQTIIIFLTACCLFIKIGEFKDSLSFYTTLNLSIAAKFRKNGTYIPNIKLFTHDIYITVLINEKMPCFKSLNV